MKPVTLFYEIRPASLGGPRWAHWRNHDTDHEYRALPAAEFDALLARAEQAEAARQCLRAEKAERDRDEARGLLRELREQSGVDDEARAAIDAALRGEGGAR